MVYIYIYRAIELIQDVENKINNHYSDLNPGVDAYSLRYAFAEWVRMCRLDIKNDALNKEVVKKVTFAHPYSMRHSSYMGNRCLQRQHSSPTNCVSFFDYALMHRLICFRVPEHNLWMLVQSFLDTLYD